MLWHVENIEFATISPESRNVGHAKTITVCLNPMVITCVLN